MPRTFSETLYDLPSVAVPDWELLERLEELFRPHMPMMTWPGLRPWHVWDDRGEYDAANVDELRSAVGQQELPPTTIRLGFSTFELDIVKVYVSTSLGSGGEIESRDEQFVHHHVARVRKLFSLAAERFDAPNPPAPPPLPTPEPATAPSSPPFWQQHGDRIEKWALVIVPVVLATLLTWWLLQ